MYSSSMNGFLFHWIYLPFMFRDDHFIVLDKTSQQFLVQIMDCYAGLVLVRPWFGRSHLWFHLVLNFRWIYLYLRFYLILCFGRIYLRFIFSSGFISSLTLDEYILFHFSMRKAYGRISLRPGFHSSMLIFHSCGSVWMNIQT